MELIHDKKGYFYFGVGSLLIVVVIIFIAIGITSPDLGNAITGWVAKLFGAVRG
jgi:hypothetical protein